MKSWTRLLPTGVALTAVLLSLTCTKPHPVSPTHPPVTRDEDAGTVFVPNATIITGDNEYFETAPLRDSGLALVITEDSSLYFYSSRLGNLDSVGLKHSCEALGLFLLANLGEDGPNAQDLDVELETGIQLRTVPGGKVECANKLHRWAAVKVSPNDDRVLLTPRSLFKVGLVDIFQGDMGNVFQFNRVPKDTVEQGSTYETYGGINRMAICPFTQPLLARQGDAIKAGFASDPEAFYCLQVLDGIDIVWVVVEAVSPIGAGTIAEAAAKAAFKTGVKAGVQGVLSEAVAQGSSELVAEVVRTGLLDAVVEAFIRYGLPGADQQPMPPDVPVWTAQSDSGEIRASVDPATVVLLILKAFKVICAGGNILWGAYDAATHDAYAAYVDTTGGNNPPNNPATPSGPSSGEVSVEYDFTSSATDPDGDDVAIRFDWGDGEISDWSDFVTSGSQVEMSYAWTSAGTFTVKAQAKDENGAVSSWSTALSVVISGGGGNNPPGIPSTPSGPPSGEIGVPYDFTSSATDPNGDDVAIRFDWGDGDTSVWSSFVASGQGVTRDHTWGSPGTYQVKAQAKDENGAASGWSVGHHVVISGGSNSPPNTPDTPAGQDWGIVHVQYEFSSFATDPDGDDVAIRFDWGDGEVSAWSGYVPSGSEVTVSHAWASWGSYDVKAQGKDEQGAESGWSTAFSVWIDPDTDVWLVKTDGSGNEAWSRTYGEQEKAEDASAVAQTADGGYIVCGTTWSFGTGSGDSDLWLIKTDASGNQVWDQTFGGSSVEHGTCVRQTSDGGYIICGTTWSFGAGAADFWLIKTDASGNKTWDRTLGGASSERARSVQQTSDGGYIIVGMTASYGAGYSDIWLVKTDASGRKTWDRTFGGTSSDDGWSVQLTADGGYVVAGQEGSASSGDACLIKIDADGNEVWYRTYGGGREDGGYSVQQCSNGGYVIAGFTDSYTTHSDVYVVRTDSLGRLLWHESYGEGSRECGKGILETSSGQFVVSTYGPFQLLCMDAGGSVLWTRSYGDVNQSPSAYSVTATSTGGYLVAGSVEYSCEAPPTTPPVGHQDRGVRKLRGRNRKLPGRRTHQPLLTDRPCPGRSPGQQ